METLPYVAYNSSNKDRARQNRNKQTQAEILLWNTIRRKQTGYTFLRQKMIWSFILDFYCSKLLLWIEVDWKIHEKQEFYDIQRDERLRHRGIKIIRYRNKDIFCDLQWVYDDILKELIIREKELASFHPPWERGGPRGIC